MDVILIILILLYLIVYYAKHLKFEYYIYILFADN